MREGGGGVPARPALAVAEGTITTASPERSIGSHCTGAVEARRTATAYVGVPDRLTLTGIRHRGLADASWPGVCTLRPQVRYPSIAIPPRRLDRRSRRVAVQVVSRSALRPESSTCRTNGCAAQRSRDQFRDSSFGPRGPASLDGGSGPVTARAGAAAGGCTAWRRPAWSSRTCAVPRRSSGRSGPRRLRPAGTPGAGAALAWRHPRP